MKKAVRITSQSQFDSIIKLSLDNKINVNLLTLLRYKNHEWNTRSHLVLELTLTFPYIQLYGKIYTTGNEETSFITETHFKKLIIEYAEQKRKLSEGAQATQSVEKSPGDSRGNSVTIPANRGKNSISSRPTPNPKRLTRVKKEISRGLQPKGKSMESC